jgi:hypothetical protein
MKIFKAIISIVFISVLSGCGGSNVDIVKNGFFEKYSTNNTYKSMTIGQALDTYFDNVKWTSFKSTDGENIVEFNGMVSSSLKDKFDDHLSNTWDLNNNSVASSFIADGIKFAKSTNDPYFLKLNQAYMCDPTPAGRFNYSPNCDDPENNEKYKADAINYVKDNIFPLGMPLKIQWVINEDETDFNLKVYSNPTLSTKYRSLSSVVRVMFGVYKK